MRSGVLPMVLGGILLGGAAAQSPEVIGPAKPQVLLELDVRDSKGKVVKTLQPVEVEILEDGVKRPIDGLRLVDQHASELQTRSAETFALPEYELVCIVFHNLDLKTRRFATEAAREFLQSELRPDTYAALFNLAGRFTPIANFTNDRAKLTEVASRMAAGSTALGSSDTAALSAAPVVFSVEGAGRYTPGNLSVTGGELSRLATGSADLSMDAGANAARGDAADERRMFLGAEGRRQMDQMRQMVQQLGALPGHKTVLLLSPGLTLSGDSADLKSLLSAAKQANLSIYAVDTQGMTQASALQGSTNILNRASNVGISTGQLGSDSPMQQQKEQMRQFENLKDAAGVANTQGGLRAVAEGTGGFLIATNDLKKPFRKVLEDLGTRYQAVYQPVSGVLDGRLHKIEVKLARPDLTVNSRTSYYALPKLSEAPLKAFEIPALAALSATPLPHSFDFQAAAYRFRPDQDVSQYVVTFEVPASTLKVTPLPDNKQARLHMSVLGLVRDSNGAVVDRVSQEVAALIPADQVSTLAGETVTLDRPLKLAPGHYTLDAVVVDHEGQKSSTMSFAFDNPSQEGLSLSDVVLVQRVEKVDGKPDAADPLEVEDRRMVPQMNPEVPRNRVPYLYFVIYPDKSKTEKPELNFQFLVNGRLVSEQTADIPPRTDSSPIPVVLSGLSQPGHCELKVVALQGDDSVEQSFRYTVAGN
jgi:VWFA-related protein